MNSKSGFFSALCLGAVLASSMWGLACAHHYYRAYDPYYSDYHVWNNDEVVYYHRWAGEYHRDPNRDQNAGWAGAAAVEAGVFSKDASSFQGQCL